MIGLHHSATVHVPLALAVLVPITQIMLLIFVWRKFLPNRIWVLNWTICGIQLVSLIVAYLTGVRDLALTAASSELLLQHQELAKYFTMVWIVITVLYPMAFHIARGRLRVIMHISLLGLLFVQLAIAVRLGKIGGQLVFGN